LSLPELARRHRCDVISRNRRAGDGKDRGRHGDDLTRVKSRRRLARHEARLRRTSPKESRATTEENVMALLKWALVALVIAGIAALFGFTQVAEGAADVAKVLFFIFMIIFVVLIVLGATAYRAVTD
jgi:uncharacterized membrane protein YtjA (UPF0391 family)